MSWKELHDLNTRNGRMQLVKLFGIERLLAEDKTQQSGTYMDGVWKTGLRELPQTFTPKHIVFFGVGMGGGLRLAAKKYPKTRITGIDWDSTLCNLARERMKNHHTITIVEAQAETWASNMDYTDLAIVDLFTGSNVAPCVRDISFLRHIITRAQVTLINIFTHTNILDEVDNAVAPLPRKRLQYYASTIGMYGSPDVRE